MLILFLSLVFAGACAWTAGKILKPRMPNPYEAVSTGPVRVDAAAGVLLGTGTGENPCIITSSELNKHVAVIGTTGSGKSTTILNFIKYAADIGQACIVIDGKGDLSLYEEIAKLRSSDPAAFYHFSMDGCGKSYNPFLLGSPTELADKIMTLTEWSEQHYKLSSYRYLQLMFRIFDNNGIVADLPLINKYCQRSLLLDLLQGRSAKKPVKAPSDDRIDFEFFDQAAKEDCREEEEIGDMYEALETIDKKAVEGLASRIGVLAEGDLRRLLANSPEAISIDKLLADKAIGLFSLDSLKYPEQARFIGRLIVSDLKTCISRHGQARRGEKAMLIFDEFNVFASSGVVDLINKSRSAGFEALIAFQSLADIDVLKQGTSIRRQIIQNCNTLVVHRQNDPKDAQELSAAFGTRETYRFTCHIKSGQEGVAGSLQKGDEYLFPAGRIMCLKTGEALVKRTVPEGTSAELVKVRNLKEG